MICDAVRTAELQWADDIAISHRRPGDAEPGGGARTAIAFPILVEGRAQAVLAFCSQAVLPRDERYVAALQNVGIQLGHVLKRKASDRQMAELALAERQRLGRELHDSLGQQMSALGMLVAALRDELTDDDRERGAELLDKLQSHVEQSQRPAARRRAIPRHGAANHAAPRRPDRSRTAPGIPDRGRYERQLLRAPAKRK